MPAILADELGADWGRVVVENAPLEPAYRNPIYHWRFTGNSMSTQSYAAMMRTMGAAAREMLIAAAAAQWGVAPGECIARAGRVEHAGSRRHVRFGDVAADAAKLPVPEKPQLRKREELTLVGRAVPRRDIPAKVDGSAKFGLDVVVPHMAYAAVRQPPVHGGSIAHFDASSVTHRPGVLAVVPVPGGVAVVAEHFWQAKTAADALRVTFADGPNAGLNTASLMAQYRATLANGPWVTPKREGDVAAASAQAHATVSEIYESPFQAHATMEPMNATADVRGDRCTVWVPTQGHEMTQIVVAQTLGIPQDHVTVNGTLVGGGFGRRLVAEFVAQAATVSRAIGRPAKVVWTREEDMTHDVYRPATLQRITAALDERGMPTAIHHQLVSPSILHLVSARSVTDTLDPSCLEGLLETRYAIPNLQADFNLLKIGVPTSVLRTTGFGPNIFAFESFIDELAHRASQDPYRYRRALLAHDSRALAVLDHAAEKSGWDRPAPPGHHRGIAFAEPFGTIITQVVELSVERNNRIRVHRVVTVADPGEVFDPGIGVSNIEGGVVWGLTTAFKSDVTFARGRTQQTNFDTYDVMRMWQMPRSVETHLLAGGGALGGLGEVGPVAIPPALTNALFAATGRRLRSVPVTRHGFSAV